jgi:orotidine-5'-phosphate decarboxylase
MDVFSKRLKKAIERTHGCLCVGLDVDLAKMPKDLPPDGQGALRFCRSIIEYTSSYAVAYKANLAFFESLGAHGFEILELLRQSIPHDTLFIADAKRGDIGNTSEAYAKALYGILKSDSTTLSPYMGKDSVEPFLKYPGTCSFVLCLTSNPSSADFQTQTLSSGEKLYEKVAREAQVWGQSSRGEVGLVVGATKAEYVSNLRKIAPDAPFLVPGVGAQGGDLEAVLKAGRADDGAGILVNVSRGILYASSGSDYAEAARLEAEKLVTQMKPYF